MTENGNLQVHISSQRLAIRLGCMIDLDMGSRVAHSPVCSVKHIQGSYLSSYFSAGHWSRFSDWMLIFPNCYIHEKAFFPLLVWFRKIEPFFLKRDSSSGLWETWYLLERPTGCHLGTAFLPWLHLIMWINVNFNGKKAKMCSLKECVAFGHQHWGLLEIFSEW